MTMSKRDRLYNYELRSMLSQAELAEYFALSFGYGEFTANTRRMDELLDIAYERLHMVYPLGYNPRPTTLRERVLAYFGFDW